MSEEIFRKKSLDKIKSPESLNDYVRVSNPGVWLLLAAVIILLAGACIWGVFGHIETTAETTVTAESGVIAGSVADARIEEGMTLRVNGGEYEIASVDTDGDTGTIMCSFTAEADVPDGEYDAVIVIESIRPMSFVLN